MTVTPSNFFDMPTDAEPIRDGGMPVLVPKGIDPASGIRARYTRASSLAEHIENQAHIHRWEMRYLAKAMGQNEDLAALAAVERYSTGISDAVYGREKSASGRRLDAIIERALDRVRIHEKADRGTAIHGATEPGAPAGVERLRDAVAAFSRINQQECIKLVGTEMFTANDEIMSSGTFDHLVLVPGHPLLTDYVVADKKTGRFSPFEWCVQISSYANGEPYNLNDDTRPAWPGPINKDWGLVWQIDSDEQSVKLWIIDLQFGWRMAKLAAAVRDGHAETGIAVEYRSATFEQRLEACNTREDLTMLWHAVQDNDDQRLLVEQKGSAL